MKYTFQGARVEVPADYVIDLSLVGLFKSWIGLDDDSGSFTLAIKPTDIAMGIDGYVADVNGIEQVVRVSIFDVYGESKEKLLSSNRYADAWYAINGYENREVISQDGLFLLFGSKGYRGDFLVLSEFPESTKEMPGNVRDFIVARCFGSNLEPFKNVTCSSKFLVEGGLLTELSYSFENIMFSREIESFAREKLDRWVEVY
ncbi:hypothetical protein [Microbulbifer aestuariivivens]|uniref:hypothetical protein n=1 Tax=Microbulbifer aestuariivivens TaxID=1908308 RepID=UPI0031EA04A2